MPLFKRKQEKQKSAAQAGGKGAASIQRTPSTRSNPQSPDSVNGDMGLPSTLLAPGKLGSPPKLILSEEVLESGREQAESGMTPKSPLKTSSHLSKTLQEILHDKDALHCFIEFMESKQADRFIRFWLDANSFQAATLTRMHSHSLQSVGSSSILKRRSEERGEGSLNGGSSRSGDVHQPQINPTETYGVGEEVHTPASGFDSTVVEMDSQERNSTDNSRFNCDNQSSMFTDRGGSDCDNAASESDWSDFQGSEHTVLNAETLDSASGGDVADTLSSSETLSTHKLSDRNPNLVMQDSTDHDSHPTPPLCRRQQLEEGKSSDVVTLVTGHTQNLQPPVDIAMSFKEKSCDTESVDTLTEDLASHHFCQDQPGEQKDTCSDAAQESTSERSVVGSTSGGQCLPEGANQGVSVIVGSHDVGSEVPVSGEEDVRQPPDGTEWEVTRHRTASAEEMREKLKKSIERDAVTIFAKYIAKDAPQPIGVDDELRGETIRKICQEDGQVDPDCFVACQEFVVGFMAQEYHSLFSDSEFHCKHQVHVLTSSTVYLVDILYNEHALCYFMEFMEQESASYLMQFWMAADNFQQQLIQQRGHYDGMQAQSDAMILYDRFFSLQATTPLGFEDKIRFEVEGNICREEGPLPDCFAKPRDIVLHTMDKVYFPRYMCSDIYYRYLSDLINTVQISQDLPVKKHRRQASDASSEHSAGSHSLGAESISFRNTLLASGSRTARKSTSSGSLSTSTSKVEEQLGNMDSDFLNPEKLWTQPKKGPLSFGKVNALGQFVSEFEPPDPEGEKKKGGGFFKKRKEKEKEQEEMAMQVAQMIISDVAAMTQMGDACSGRDDNFNTSNNTATTKSLSLSAPVSAKSFFEPPPS